MKNTYIKILSFSVLIYSTLIISSCTKVAPAPTSIAPSVNTTNAIINVTSTTAQSGGTVTNDGGTIITANGVCYSSTNQKPTISDTKTSEAVANSGIAYPTYVSNLTGLSPNTTYYLRAYATNSAGTGYGAVLTFKTASNLVSLSVTVTTFAGNGTAGYVDGSGTGAQFNNPQSLTIDKLGNVFVSDTYNNYIREINSSGLTSTIAGDGNIGFLNGSAANAEFYAPQGLAFDATSNLYIADFGNNVVRKLTTAGVVSTFIGTGQAGYNDGTNPLFYYYNNPTGVAFDSKGNLFIADRGNNVIRKVTPAGVSSTFAGTRTAGYVDSTGVLASFNKPNALAIDASDNIYVADLGNHAIRKITPAGKVTTLAGGPSHSQLSLLNLPAGIAVDKNGNLFITDEAGRILEYTNANVLYILAGNSDSQPGFTNGTGADALFNLPQGIVVDASGTNIYVADKNNNCIRKITISSVQ